MMINRRIISNCGPDEGRLMAGVEVVPTSTAVIPPYVGIPCEATVWHVILVSMLKLSIKHSSSPEVVGEFVLVVTL